MSFAMMAHTNLTQKLQKLRASVGREPVHGEDAGEMEEDSENLQPLQQMARLTQLRDLLCAHHTIGTESQSCCFLLFFFKSIVTVIV